MEKKQNNYKREFYIFSFTVLGFLIGLVIYGLGSLVLIQHGYNISFGWYLAILLVGGTISGFMEGRRWWDIIYVRKAYLKWPKHVHETKLLGVIILIVFTIAIIFLAHNY